MAWNVTITIQDNKRKLAYMSFHIWQYDPSLEQSVSFEDAENGVLDLLPILVPLIAGKIIGVHIGRPIAWTTTKPEPDDTSDVEEKGVFKFGTGESEVIITIPTIRDDIFIDGTGDIDEFNEYVAPFTFAMYDGSGSALEYYKASDNRDVPIAFLINGKKRFRKSSKRR